RAVRPALATPPRPAPSKPGGDAAVPLPAVRSAGVLAPTWRSYGIPPPLLLRCYPDPACSNRRRSSTKGSTLTRILLASGWAGFRSTLDSGGITAEGTNRRQLRPLWTHASPASTQKGWSDEAFQ